MKWKYIVRVVCVFYFLGKSIVLDERIIILLIFENFSTWKKYIDVSLYLYFGDSKITTEMSGQEPSLTYL